MTHNSLSKKDRKALRKAGGPSGNKRTIILLAGFTVLVIAAIGVFSFLVTGGGGNDQSFTPNTNGLLPVGSQAPDFSAQTVDGGNVSLGDRGNYKATMLVFFASWCPHCNREAPLISDIQKNHDDLRVIMAGIDGQDNNQKVQDFVNKYDINGPAFYDPSVGSTYHASSYPTIYVIDGSGKIAAANSGEVPKDVLDGWVQNVLGSSG